jgi:hypothetical protein
VPTVWRKTGEDAQQKEATMKKLFAATAAAALMAATGAWAQGTAGQVPGQGSPMGVTPATPGHAAGGAQTMGPEGAPGVTGTQGGSSTDSSPASGGTGQPGTGQRSIDQTNPPPMGGSSGTMGAPPGDTGTGSP